MTANCGIRTHSEIYKTGSREYSLLFMGSTLFALRTDSRWDSYATRYFYHRFGILLTLNIWRYFLKLKEKFKWLNAKFTFVLYTSLSVTSLLIGDEKNWSLQQVDWKGDLLAKTYKILCDKSVYIVSKGIYLFWK